MAKRAAGRPMACSTRSVLVAASKKASAGILSVSRRTRRKGFGITRNFRECTQTSWGVQRQAYAEGAALALDAGHVHGTAVEGHDLADDIEAQPHAADLARVH